MHIIIAEHNVKFVTHLEHMMDYKKYKALKSKCNSNQNDVITCTYIGCLDYVIMTENIDLFSYIFLFRR